MNELDSACSIFQQAIADGISKHGYAADSELTYVKQCSTHQENVVLQKVQWTPGVFELATDGIGFEPLVGVTYKEINLKLASYWRIEGDVEKHPTLLFPISKSKTSNPVGMMSKSSLDSIKVFLTNKTTDKKAVEVAQNLLLLLTKFGLPAIEYLNSLEKLNTFLKIEEKSDLQVIPVNPVYRCFLSLISLRLSSEVAFDQYATRYTDIVRKFGPNYVARFGDLIKEMKAK